MNRKKILKIVAILAVAGLLIGGGIGAYMFFMPHRDIQKSPTDFALTSSELVAEYLNDMEQANQKYLSADGESKILEITGTVAGITEDYNGQQVVLLKEPGQVAGVSCTFMQETNSNATALNIGQSVTIKGVIRSGVFYDPDLEMHLNAVLEKSDVVF
ncbi:MAG: OB-fold putative lipoprotein [Bacteroidales bacterium]|nr:OB-fold putative lipoprotein [Bacteroidales bacterium]